MYPRLPAILNGTGTILDTSPCTRCGYHSLEPPCPHCGTGGNAGATWSLRRRGGPVLGLEAFVQGGRLLWSLPGSLRRLAAPALLTGALALWAHHAWISPWIAGLFASLEPERLETREPGIWRSLLAFLSDSWLLQLLSGTAQGLALILTVWLAFSFVFEALAGPFLDGLHAQLERRWFGADPRVSDSAPGRMAGMGRELHMLLLSILAASGAAAVSLAALPLLLIPLLGGPLYLAVSGMAIALGAMDTAFARRRWTLAQRIRLLRHHWASAASFGALAGFVLSVPLLGPLAVVPCASLGGLWMLVRLEKTPARPDRPARTTQSGPHTGG